MTSVAALPILTTIGNPPVSSLGLVWDPWPNPDLWEIIHGVPDGFAKGVETYRSSHYLYPWRRPQSGGRRSEIWYDTLDLARFSLDSSSVFLRWRPPINYGTPDYFMGLRLHDDEDGDNLTWVDVQVAPGGAAQITKLSPQPDQPSGATTGQDAKWDPSGTYLALAHWGGNKLAVYKWDGAALTLLDTPVPSEAPEGGADSVCWDPTGTYLCVGHYAAPTVIRFSWYKRSGDTFTELADPDPAPESDVWGIDWDPTGTWLVMAQYEYGTTSLRVYERTGDTLTALSPLPTQPGSDAQGVKFSPDGTLVAVIHWNSPDFLSLYSFSDGVMTKLSDPDVPPEGEPFDLAWDPSGTYLAVGHYSYGASCVSVYKRSGTTLTRLSWDWEPDGSYGIYGLTWDSTGGFLFVTHDGSNGISWAARVEDYFTVMSPDPPPLGAYNGWRLDLHPIDHSTLAVAQYGSTGNHLSLYSFAGGLQMTIDVQAWSYPWISGYMAAGYVSVPYDPDAMSWLRIRHSSSTIYVDTAGSGCLGWTNQLSVLIEHTVPLNKFGVEARMWVDSNAEDTADPRPGVFGPFNPEPTEKVLWLWTQIGEFTGAEGDSRKTLPLLTEIQ